MKRSLTELLSEFIFGLLLLSRDKVFYWDADNLLIADPFKKH